MTDEQPTTDPIPAAIVCDREGCHALVPDTLDDRRAHRRGHDHDDRVMEAIRKELRALRADFGALRGAVRDDVRGIREEVQGIDRAVGKIEIPEPQAPLEIRRGGWDDDDSDEGTAAAGDLDEWDFGTTDEPAPDATAPEQPGTAPLAAEPDLDDLTDTPDPTDAATRPFWARS